MVKAMKRQMRSLVRSHFVRGLSSLLDVAEPAPRSYHARDTMQALRGDMKKIGADMYRVIDREQAVEKAKAARKEITAAE